MYSVGKSIQCEICKIKLTCQYNLLQHQKQIHNVTKKYKCTKCNKNFVHKHHRIRHYINEHYEDYAIP